MKFFVKIILPYLLVYKYGAIFVVTFLASLVIPIPPGTLLMAASAFASQGYLSFGWVLFYGIAGNIIGDNIGYWIARTHGRDALIRMGFGSVLANEKYAGLERRVRQRPGWFIFLTRFEVVSNLSVNLIAGLGKVPYRTYLLYEAIGEVMQVTLYGSIGYLFGDNWQSISAIIDKTFLVLILVLVFLALVFWKQLTGWLEAAGRS